MLRLVVFSKDAFLYARVSARWPLLSDPSSQYSPRSKYKQRAAPRWQRLVNRVWLETAGVSLRAHRYKAQWMVGYSKARDLFIQAYKDTDAATDPVITSIPSLPIKTHLFDVPISLEL